MISDRVIGRLALYRRLLSEVHSQGVAFIDPGEIAQRISAPAAQVRRDLSVVGCVSSFSHGYAVAELLQALMEFLSGKEGQRVALVGVGNLGHALLSYFVGGRSQLTIVVAFDSDERKAGRVISGCRCYHTSELSAVVREEGVSLAILAVPELAAQALADDLVNAGVRGIVNFAPLFLKTPQHVFVENIDLAMSLEKVAYFARQSDRG